LRFSARSLYRSRQFFRYLRASINDDEGDEVARLLSPRESALFFAMTARDQRHSLDVLHRLHGQGQTDSELLSAALLHDVGKGRIRLWHRVAYVLIRAACPRLLRRSASGRSSWRGALMAIANHAERGASLVQAAGSSDEVVRLIRYHESPDGGDARQALLRAADEKC
jgi:predicted HD phosphohydrolase